MSKFNYVDLYYIAGPKKLKEFFERRELNPLSTYFCFNTVSCLSDAERMIPPEFMLYKFWWMIPTAPVLNIFFQKGECDEFTEACKKYWLDPKCWIYINWIIMRAVKQYKDGFSNVTIVFYIAKSEEENFHFKKMLIPLLDEKYGVKFSKLKNIGKGKLKDAIKETFRFKAKEVLDICKRFHEHYLPLFEKLDVEVHPTMGLRITKPILKRIDNKKNRKFYKKFLEKEPD